MNIIFINKHGISLLHLHTLLWEMFLTSCQLAVFKKRNYFYSYSPWKSPMPKWQAEVTAHKSEKNARIMQFSALHFTHERNVHRFLCFYNRYDCTVMFKPHLYSTSNIFRTNSVSQLRSRASTRSRSVNLRHCRSTWLHLPPRAETHKE